MKSILLSVYWPNLHYCFYAFNSDHVLIEQEEHYEKQSFRNRCQILSANGVLNLVIPIINKGQKTCTREIEIDYKEKWQNNHWRAITSAYKNSPYFDFFEEEIFEFYNHEEQYLLQYNLRQLQLIYKILRKKRNYECTTSFSSSYLDLIDKRFEIHPKILFEQDENVNAVLNKKYYQTFSDKFGFTSNLTILDLIFNEGKGALTYLNNTF